MPMSPRLLRPMSAGGFNPRRISGLSAWYDASVASSVTLTGGFVSQWSDLSGAGHHLTQSVEADRPGTSTIGGKTAIDFDGTSDYLSNATTPPGFTYGTIFCVHNTDTGGSRAIYGVCGSSTQVMGASRHTTAGEYRCNAGSGGTVNRSGGVNTTGATKLISQTFDSGSSSHAVRIDGTDLTGTTGGFFSNVAGMWLGARNSTTFGLSLFYDGKIGEWVIYNRVLSATEITRVERYLAAKWGVTLYSPPTYADADVNAYITAVELADGGLMLEPGVRDAINDFITGCKADGIWSAIKSSCILMGARTLSGALVPLVGTAPSNNGPFVAGDYDRKLGLVGNGTSKYLDTNRNANADPQDNFHFAFYLSVTFNAATLSAGAGGAFTGATQIQGNQFRCRNGTGDMPSVSMGAVSLHGMSRSGSADYVGRAGGTSQTFTRASQTPFNGNLLTHARLSGGTAGLFSGMRINYYSIGESLNLATLESRVSTLASAIGAAIP